MTLHSSARRVPIARMAITVPPDGWFHGIARALFDRYRQALIDLDVAVFEVPLEAFLIPDAGRIPTLIEELRAFRPECAFGLPLGSYALLCRLPADRDGWRPNLFTDVLDVPTICLWDHAPVELADQLLTPIPQDPAASVTGARTTLARVLTHPRLIHWSRDSGQTRIMKELGYLRPNRLIEERPPVLPGFLNAALDTPTSPDAAAPRVSFVGHLYQEPANYPHPALGALADGAVQAWAAAGWPSLWDVLRHHIARMPDEQRRGLALDADDTHFWRFAHRLICHEAQTSLRLALLGAATVPVACYGNLRTDLRDVPTNLVAVPSSVPYGPQLAALFARHEITLDVLNPGFVEGYSHKQVHGFASGGFMLMNRKRDFVDAFGDAGEAVSCVGADDLAVKVDRFLSAPAYRREVGDAIREQIRARFQLKDVLVRALEAASLCMETTGSNPVRAHTRRSEVAATIDLLSTIKSKGGSSVHYGTAGALVSTPPQAWAYAAAIPIPAVVSTMHEPHLRLSLIVEAGRIGLAGEQDDTRGLVAEQFVSPTVSPITVIVELPHTGIGRVIMRNTAETVSRALVLGASLCDRSA